MRWLKAAVPAYARVGMARRAGARPLRHHPWVMIWTMAVAQVISWGTLFYGFSLFVVPMHEALGGRVHCSTVRSLWVYSAPASWPFLSASGLTTMAAGG